MKILDEIQAAAQTRKSESRSCANERVRCAFFQAVGALVVKAEGGSRDASLVLDIIIAALK